MHVCIHRRGAIHLDGRGGGLGVGVEAVARRSSSHAQPRAAVQQQRCTPQARRARARAASAGASLALPAHLLRVAMAISCEVLTYLLTYLLRVAMAISCEVLTYLLTYLLRVAMAISCEVGVPSSRSWASDGIPPAFAIASQVAASTERCHSALAARSRAIRLPFATRPMSGGRPPAVTIALRRPAVASCEQSSTPRDSRRGAVRARARGGLPKPSQDSPSHPRVSPPPPKTLLFPPFRDRPVQRHCTPMRANGASPLQAQR